MKRTAILTAILTTMITMSCKSQIVQTISPEDWAETTFLRYDFTDSSTPPDCHRSYYIGIDKDSIRVSVSSYGELLRREVFPSSQEILDKAKATLASQDIKKIKPKEESLICGGTTDALSFFKGNEEKSYFSASVYGGIGTLSISGNPAAAFLQALPVSIESIIQKTYRRPQPPMMISVSTREGNKDTQNLPEVMPKYRGGETELQDAIYDEIQLPDELYEKKFKATVTVNAVISEDGNVDDAWVAKSNNKLLDPEIIRCVKKLCRWQPGLRNGKPASMICEFTVVVIRE